MARYCRPSFVAFFLAASLVGAVTIDPKQIVPAVLQLTGGTVTGQLKLTNNPPSTLCSAAELYFDPAAIGAGELMMCAAVNGGSALFSVDNLGNIVTAGSVIASGSVSMLSGQMVIAPLTIGRMPTIGALHTVIDSSVTSTGTGLSAPTLIGSTSVTSPIVNAGTAGVVTGAVNISGVTSGTVKVTVPSVAGTLTYKLPPAVAVGGVWTDVAGDGVLTEVAPTAAPLNGTVFGAGRNMTAEPLIGFGDSITAGVGGPTPTDVAHAWFSLVNVADQTTGTNLGNPGDTAMGGSSTVFGRAVPNGYQFSTWAFGINDMRIYAPSAPKRDLYLHEVYAELGYLAIPDVKKVYASDASFTGAWGGDGHYTYGAPGKSAQFTGTAGATATVTVWGTCVLAVTAVYDSGATGINGSFTISVDGSNVVTAHDAFLAGIRVGGGSTSAPWGIMTCGLSAGPHKVVYTHVAGNYSTFAWAAGNAGLSPLVDRPRVLALTTSRMTAAGYVGGGGSDADVASYGDAVRTAVADFQTAELAVEIADVTTVLNQTTHLGSDGLHWSDLGHSVVATLVESRALLSESGSLRARGFVSKSLVVNGTTPTDDVLNLSVTTGGAASFTGVDTMADLSAARTWTRPNKSGTYAMTSDIPEAVQNLFVINETSTGATKHAVGIIRTHGPATPRGFEMATWTQGTGGGTYVLTFADSATGTTIFATTAPFACNAAPTTTGVGNIPLASTSQIPDLTEVTALVDCTACTTCGFGIILPEMGGA